MLISEVAVALTEHYREHKKANGGHKTAADGSYGFKSLRYKVRNGEKEFGPFLGRGSALICFRDEVKGKALPVEDTVFVVETIFIPKNKEAEVEVRETVEFPVTIREKAGRLTEEEKILKAVAKAKGNKTAAAKALGISADTLRRKLKKIEAAKAAPEPVAEPEAVAV